MVVPHGLWQGHLRAGRPEAFGFRQDGEIVAEHSRRFGRDQTAYDPWHYVPVLTRKPGTLRNGAPFKDWVLPVSMERIRRHLAGSHDGDRQMVDILAAVLTDGLVAVEAACAEALEAGLASADVILNALSRRQQSTVTSAQIMDTDDSTITIGIVNSGARDSFMRSESDVILSAAFNDVVGIERKIEVIVDSSINPNSNAAKTMRVDEDPSDENQLTGKDLLMKELGARVISESE